MPLVHLPKRCDILKLLEAFDSESVLAGDWDTLSIHVPKGCFLSSSAITFLGAWGLYRLKDGARIQWSGDPDTLRYLSRIDLLEHLEADYSENHQRHDETGRFLPLRLIHGYRDVGDATSAVCEIVLQNYENARALMPAVQWALTEIIDNVVSHADTVIPGIVYAQSYPKKHLIDVTVCDVGLGIKATLHEKYAPRSHGQAILKALEPQVTGSDGGGNGLAGTLEIARANRGGLQIWSGDSAFTIATGKEKGFRRIPETLGTGVVLRIDTRRPVDVDQTSIARGADEWTYIDAEARDFVEEGGLLVVENCVHTVGREPARRLRNKVEALLPSVDPPAHLTLDFAGVEAVNSSFFDELLGRLVERHGPGILMDRLRIRGLGTEQASMAESAIRNRLGDEPPTGSSQ